MHAGMQEEFARDERETFRCSIAECEADEVTDEGCLFNSTSLRAIRGTVLFPSGGSSTQWEVAGAPNSRQGVPAWVFG